jgi:hypothetical protein
MVPTRSPSPTRTRPAGPTIACSTAIMSGRCGWRRRRGRTPRRRPGTVPARRRGAADPDGRPVRSDAGGHHQRLDPLPHQITAVYGDLVPRTPLGFLLADDPGAGKTIARLVESLYRGYPSGSLLFWRTLQTPETRAVAAEAPTATPVVPQLAPAAGGQPQPVVPVDSHTESVQRLEQRRVNIPGEGEPTRHLWKDIGSRGQHVRAGRPGHSHPRRAGGHRPRGGHRDRPPGGPACPPPRGRSAATADRNRPPSQLRSRLRWRLGGHKVRPTVLVPLGDRRRPVTADGVTVAPPGLQPHADAALERPPARQRITRPSPHPGLCPERR